MSDRPMTEDEWRAAAETVGYDLLGTCQSLLQCLEKHEIDEDADSVTAFTDRLDQIAWECKGCNWWVEPCEVDDNDRCEQCRDDEGASDD